MPIPAAFDAFTVARPAAAGTSDVVVTTGCGSTTSNPAVLTLACRSDFNRDGHVDVQDYLAFLSAYAAGCP